MKSVTRVVHHEDALAWLETQDEMAGCSFVTSLPDASEFPKMNLEAWKAWFVRAASLVLSRCPDDGVVIFYQTDIKKDGVWIDKSYLCQKAAEECGHALITHKIVCRGEIGNPTFGRPAFSHLIAFSRGIRPNVALSSADVLHKAGDVTWTRGMGVKACLAACRFVKAHTASHTIVDPFCGHGTVLAIANELGFDAFGVELSRKRTEVARTLRTVDFEIVLEKGIPGFRDKLGPSVRS